jgi:hypothetical protein
MSSNSEVFSSLMAFLRGPTVIFEDISTGEIFDWPSSVQKECEIGHDEKRKEERGKREEGRGKREEGRGKREGQGIRVKDRGEEVRGGRDAKKGRGMEDALMREWVKNGSSTRW